MAGRLIRFLLTVAAVGALAWAARKALIRWIDGPAHEPSTAPWGPIAAPAAEPAAVVAPAEPAVVAPAEPAVVAPAEPAAEAPAGPVPTAPKKAVKAAPARKKPATRAGFTEGDAKGGAGWVAPGESGACPDGHPVKAKLGSRLYHLPGMAAYARTSPDRCYVSAEAAEEDGFKRAKR